MRRPLRMAHLFCLCWVACVCQTSECRVECHGESVALSVDVG